MKLISIVALSVVAFSAAACGDKEHLRPVVSIDSDGSSQISYIATDTPTLSRWSNGLIKMTCPAGFHFDVTDIPAIADRPAFQEATCATDWVAPKEVVRSPPRG